MEKSSRIGKRLRLPQYDYSEQGAYFITFCTKDRKAMLSQIIPSKSVLRSPEVQMTAIGELVESAILQIPQHYPGVEVGQYVIMPNHVHLLLRLTADQSPKLGRIVQQLKGHVTKQYGQSIWQEKYYDHVIRNGADYLIKSQYIENNPAKWVEDEYYITPQL